MAFSGSAGGFSLGDLGGSMGGSMSWLNKPLIKIEGFGKEMAKVGKDLGKSMAPHVAKSAKQMKEAHKDKDKVKEMGNMFSMIGGMALGPINAMLSFLDKLGVVGPIMDVLNGLMAIFSGTLMEAIMPAFQELFDVLLSDDTIELIKTLAIMFGNFLVPMIKVFAGVLKIMMPIWLTLAEMFGKLLLPILPIIAKGIGMLVMLGFFPLVLAIYAVGLAIAALIQLFTGVPAIADWQDFMLPMLGSMVMALPTIMSMQHGGYVPATLGGQMIRAGEGGEGEHVIPESQMREVIWVTEDNGKRLDKIYMALVNSGRLI